MEETSKDYSDEPPSSWTSISRCIQLYEQGANDSGELPRKTLAQLVRLRLLGAPAHPKTPDEKPRSEDWSPL